jgi:NADH oxidase (H2O-forming)
MDSMKIKEGIYWVGALDPDLRVFDVIMKAENGTSYNSYLVKGSEKTALIETVKLAFFEEHLARISSVFDPAKLDYIVLDHTEPDHSGSLPRLLEVAANAKVVSSKPAESFIKNILNMDIDILTVGDGDKIDLGGKELEFVSAPFLHWPDTMFTYVRQDEVLFPCDFLGCHFSDPRLFNDEVEDFNYAYQYYFNHILGPFKKNVLDAIEKIKDLPIDTFAPSHGPVLRKDPWSYIELYKQWASVPVHDPNNPKIAIFYVGPYGNTRVLAKEIMKGVQEAGVSVSLFDLLGTEMGAAVAQIEAADGVIVGSATINGDAIKPIWDLLSSLGIIRVKGKLGTAFGSYGWSGEAPKFIAQRLKDLGFKVQQDPLRIRLVPSESELEQSKEFGRQFADSLRG